MSAGRRFLALTIVTRIPVGITSTGLFLPDVAPASCNTFITSREWAWSCAVHPLCMGWFRSALAACSSRRHATEFCMQAMHEGEAPSLSRAVSGSAFASSNRRRLGGSSFSLARHTALAPSDLVQCGSAAPSRSARRQERWSCRMARKTAVQPSMGRARSRSARWLMSSWRQEKWPWCDARCVGVAPGMPPVSAEFTSALLWITACRHSGAFACAATWARFAPFAFAMFGSALASRSMFTQRSGSFAFSTAAWAGLAPSEALVLHGSAWASRRTLRAACAPHDAATNAGVAPSEFRARCGSARESTRSWRQPRAFAAAAAWTAVPWSRTSSLAPPTPASRTLCRVSPSSTWAAWNIARPQNGARIQLCASV
mmetsp:Transcript_41272/g.116834  ORF Transcript_41272/g.116834 Transcript_41272/m.116834 type:complete len:371 (+) Transcript_41272:411-1523(+)